jgi:hypothetical protein
MAYSDSATADSGRTLVETPIVGPQAPTDAPGNSGHIMFLTDHGQGEIQHSSWIVAKMK